VLRPQDRGLGRPERGEPGEAERERRRELLGRLVADTEDVVAADPRSVVVELGEGARLEADRLGGLGDGPSVERHGPAVVHERPAYDAHRRLGDRREPAVARRQPDGPAPRVLRAGEQQLGDAVQRPAGGDEIGHGSSCRSVRNDPGPAGTVIDTVS
jgi:hypothetical protein